MSALVVLDSTDPAGRLLNPQQPLVCPTDVGISRGDGVFETLLATGTHIRKAQAHIDRLLASAHRIQLTPIPAAEQWDAAAQLTLDAHLREEPPTCDQKVEAGGGERTIIKLIAVHGPTDQATPSCWIAASTAPPPRSQPLHVVTLSRGYSYSLRDADAPWLLTGIKSLSYGINMAALRHARAKGYDDVLFTSTEGYVLDGATASLLIAERTGDGVKLRTPSPAAGILPGTSQSALFELAQNRGWCTEHAALTPNDIVRSEGAWLVSSVRGPVAIASIDGAPVPSEPTLAAAVQDMFKAIT